MEKLGSFTKLVAHISMHKISSFIIFASILTILSCKETESELRIIPIDTEMSGYLFDTGSYWEYNLDNDTLTETQFLSGAVKNAITFGGSGLGGYALMWDMSIKTSNSETINYSIIYNALWFKYNEKMLLRSGKVDTVNIFNHYAKIAILDTFTVNGKLYQKVQLTEVYSDLDKKSNTFERYWLCDSIGIIKWEQYSSGIKVKTKSLKSYKIRLAPRWFEI
jgi:hypothetical protein